MSEITEEEKAMFRDAIADLTQIIDDNPEQFESYNDRGFAYYVIQEFDKAIADLRISISLCPTDPFAFYVYNLVVNEMQKENTSVDELRD